jgi:acetylornithine deacetylase/succinyl-diaminopimelate desuccinylase-like protein
MQVVLDHLKRNQTRFMAELCDLIRFPSVSAQPQHKKDLRACAEWIVKHCRRIGLEATLRLTAGNPVVVAKIRQGNATDEPRGSRGRSPTSLKLSHCHALVWLDSIEAFK